MIDLKSILGYSKGSPYANNPFLDIFTPEGLIDMSNTPKDLLGIDNKGNKKKMKANNKNPYKFEGDMVREVPMQTGGITPLQQANIDAKRMAKSWGLINAEDVYVDKIPQYIDAATGRPYVGPPVKALPVSLPPYVSPNDVQSDGSRYWYMDPKTTDLVDVDPRAVRSKKPLQMGGNPYHRQSLSPNDIYKFLFAEDDIEDSKPAPSEATAPSEEEVAPKVQEQEDDNDLAMQLVMQDFPEAKSYNSRHPSGEVPITPNSNPYTGTNSNFYTSAQSLEGMRYKFGASGNPGEGGIDCSGAVCKIVGLPRMSSEQIVSGGKNFRKFAGDPNDLTEGTVLGFDTGPTNFDKGRTYGIDHTGIIVKNPNTGQLEYKHSAGSTGFKTLTIPQMLEKYKNAKSIYLGQYKYGGAK